jgi:error-prone DNA polymerase
VFPVGGTQRRWGHPRAPNCWSRRTGWPPSDKTGITNVVVWPRILDLFRKEVMGARLLLVEGRIQKNPDGVVHLVAERIRDRSADLHQLEDDEPVSPEEARTPPRIMRNLRLMPRSRDFH